MSPGKYLSCIISLSVVLFAPLAQGQPGSDAEAIKNRLVGSYRLVSFNSIDENGNAVRRPYSVGRISYDGVGRMTAQLMPEGWDASASTSSSGAGFISYFGTFTIDTDIQAVIHHVEGAYNANMLGRSMVRYFEFSADGNSLFLETRNDNRTTGRLRWDRILTED
jgi:hypothetical protein